MTTPNLGLAKPDGTDAVDIDVINGNMDLLDTAVASKAATSSLAEVATSGDYDDLANVPVVDAPTVIALTDGATPALDASQGSYFRLAAGGDRTIAVPTNPTDGQAITIEHMASGGARTLALNTGTGGFLFGETVTALSATTSGKRDMIRAIYNSALDRWMVVGYLKGF